MQDHKDYLGDKFRLIERAQEDIYFRKLDEELLNEMRERAAQETDESEMADDTPVPGNTFTPILVPVDFSSYSTQALRTGADLAARFGASMIVLHVIDRETELLKVRHHLERTSGASGDSIDTQYAEGPNDWIETLVIDHREQAYQALQTFLPPQLTDQSVELRVVVGSPFERIVETAVQDDIALIVMGTHGRTGLAHLALGSIAERVVCLAPCPVMTVKDPSPETKSWLAEFYNTFLQSHAQ
ncbi:MAG: hypothetical protein ETSY1_19560 [Candidatus Entotheonella factor]|uniref:UspA domain-containing protein n=1 Tax=Entotheonella factor TaxID=1429438 RepID=W4LK16_ENTF1|nr:MAG: hypothetical protein ETSY1_19560 [Candidatus Entotheonella factor]